MKKETLTANNQTNKNARFISFGMQWQILPLGTMIVEVKLASVLETRPDRLVHMNLTLNGISHTHV